MSPHFIVLRPNQGQVSHTSIAKYPISTRLHCISVSVKSFSISVPSLGYVMSDLGSVM